MGSFMIDHRGSTWHVCLAVETESGRITRLGWDTDGTGREGINLLNDDAEITLEHVCHGNQPMPDDRGKAIVQPGSITWSVPVRENVHLSWQLGMQSEALQARFSCDGDAMVDIEELVLYVPFNPRIAIPSIIANNWDGGGQFEPPFVLSVPDIGQVLITATGHARAHVKCDIEGNRRLGCLDLVLHVPVPVPGAPLVLELAPVVLAQPPGFADVPAWRSARRGWFNMLQFSCGASGGGVPVKGVWANNTLSDPVSSLLYMLGDATLMVPEICPGVSMPPILQRAIEYWLDHKTGADGLVAYTAGGKDQHVMDGNPAVLIAAWCYVEASGDVAWLASRIEQTEHIARYMEHRDVDGDGIIESMQSGNWGSQAIRDPDCAWDCYVSGHKNAYVNALAYRAWLCMAMMEQRLDRGDLAVHYQQLASRLKASYVPTFLDPATGWLGFWRSQDGQLHEIHNDSPASLAISYGLVDASAGEAMLRAFWVALARTGFRRFELGIPLNLVPVPPVEMSAYFEFQQFLNGGCCVSNASWFIDGLYRVGMKDEAGTILDAMLARQRYGVFPNGGGFQNGFIDKMGFGAEVFDWEGRPAGYEGHLVYCWAFLQSLLLREPAIQARLHPRGDRTGGRPQ